MSLSAQGWDENLCRPWQFREAGLAVTGDRPKSLNDLVKLFPAPDLLYTIKVILSLSASGRTE